MRRSGFALAELVVALVIAGIIGVALTRLVVSQSRFVSTQDGMMRARSGARAALNAIGEELRMVGDSGLVAAGRDSVTIRVPFATGVSCGSASGSPATTVMLLPTDSARFFGAVISGYAWQDTVGKWHLQQPATRTAGLVSTCASAVPAIASISAPGWSATAVAVDPKHAATKVGAPIYLYHLVTFRFAASTDMPGRIALWRRAPSAGQDEEMVTPFDTSSKFQFLVGPLLSVRSTPPAILDSVRGVRVHLISASENTPAGRSTPLTFSMITNLLFRNHE